MTICTLLIPLFSLQWDFISSDSFDDSKKFSVSLESTLAKLIWVVLHLKMLRWNSSIPSSYCTMLWSYPQAASAAQCPKSTGTRSQAHLCSPWDAHSPLLGGDLGRPGSQPFSQRQLCCFLPLPQRPEMNSSHTLEFSVPCPLVTLQGLIKACSI